MWTERIKASFLLLGEKKGWKSKLKKDLKVKERKRIDEKIYNKHSQMKGKNIMRKWMRNGNCIKENTKTRGDKSG